LIVVVVVDVVVTIKATARVVKVALMIENGKKEFSVWFKRQENFSSCQLGCVCHFVVED
jgi:hypothetical protein